MHPKIKNALFFLCLLVYGVFSNPTPDDPGIPELIIGLCLILYSGVSGAFGAIGGFLLESRGFSGTLLGIIFIYLFFPLVVIGVLNGYEFNEIIRDLIPYLFFFIPIFIWNNAHARPDEFVKISSWLLVFISLSYSIRHFIDAGVSVGRIGEGFYNNSQMYLSTDSSILFGLVFLTLTGFQLISHKKIVGVVLLLLSVFPLALLLIRGHRSPIAIYLVIMIAHFLVGSSFRTKIAIASSALVATYFAWDKIISVMELFVRKTQAVGSNARLEEAATIMTLINENVVTLFFGLGWGGVFANPAIGYHEVNYSHWIVTYFLLKGGLIGMVLVCAYIILVARYLYELYSVNRILFYSISAPVLVAFTTNPSFRTLSFGVLVSVLIVCVNYNKSLKRIMSHE